MQSIKMEEGNLSTPDQEKSMDRGQPRKKTRRTGQACDRCRSRKIKCDGKLPSCSPCETAKVLCKTTDRTSNRTVPRGYLEELEAKLRGQQKLQARIQELEARLRELDPTRHLLHRNTPVHHNLTPPETSNTHLHSLTLPSPNIDYTQEQPMSPQFTPYPGDHSIGNSVIVAPFPPLEDIDSDTNPGVFESGDAGKGWYLGCASGMVYMNSIKNTASSVLGIELDLSEFSPLSKPVSGKSIPGLLSELHAHRSRKPVRPLLPPKDLGIELVHDFFATINLLCPLLHKPSFYRELDQCYDDPSYIPSSAFVVQYNMIMAIAARVRPPSQYHYPGVTPSHYPVASAQAKLKPTPNNSSFPPKTPSRTSHDQFYSRMLPYFPELLHEPGLSDLQALLLVMVYLIGIYKMGHLWHLSRIISAVALELGLHRSDANWSNFNPLEREMRKRVFILTVGLDLKVANSLGRPPSFRLQDSDVSLPAYMDDEYIDETGVRPMPEGQIPQLAPAIELAMLIRISSSVTDKLFGVSKGRGQRSRYVDAVLKLERELQEWRDRAPPYINFDLTAPPETSPFWIANAGLFLMYNEMRLLIRHPSMGRLSPSPGFFAESLSICAEASRNILSIINRFRDFRQLECHPQSVSTIILASLTILYSLWEKGGTTKQEIEKEMQVPLDILEEIGQTYGPTRKLHKALATLVSATIENLDKSKSNVSNVSGFSFDQPETSALNPQDMQVPMRIETGLHVGPNSTPHPTSPAVIAQPRPLHLPNVAATWDSAESGLSVASLPRLPNESQGNENIDPGIDTSQFSPTNDFENPLLWTPSLDWNGGWDDFLNAIAM